MSTKTIAVPASETHLADAIRVALQSGVAALVTFAATVSTLAEREALTADQCGAAVARWDWGLSTRTAKRFGRMARAICEVPASKRKARIAALLVCPKSYATIGSVDSIMTEHGWGLAGSGSGSNNPKAGTAKAPSHKTDKPETAKAEKMTASRLAEYITSMAANPKAFAALNKALADAGLRLELLAEETEAE